MTNIPSLSSPERPQRPQGAEGAEGAEGTEGPRVLKSAKPPTSWALDKFLSQNLCRNQNLGFLFWFQTQVLHKFLVWTKILAGA